MPDDPIQTFIDEALAWRDRLRADPEAGNTPEFLEFSKVHRHHFVDPTPEFVQRFDAAIKE